MRNLVTTKAQSHPGPTGNAGAGKDTKLIIGVSVTSW